MGAATQLDRVFLAVLAAPHRQHADLLAVLLAEQRHGAGGDRLFRRHQPRVDRAVQPDALVDFVLDLAQLFERNRLGVADVEAQPVGRHQRALLGDVLAEMAAQRLVQQMRRRMVGAQLGAADRVDGHDHVVADFQFALLDLGVMGMQVAHHLLHVGDRGLAVRAREAAGVAHLAARLGIEWRLVGDDPAALARLQRGDLLAVEHDRLDLALGAFGVVA